MKRSLFALVFLLAALAPVYSQVAPPPACTISTTVPLINAKGESELVSDTVMTCTFSGPSTSTFVNISLFLNTSLTSRITNPVPTPPDSEALLLIDEPSPGVANISNGCPYFGQVLGASGVAACAPGSGNVYQAQQTNSNVVTWFGVPYVTGGTRVFRMTNIRANPVLFGGGGGVVMNFVAVAGPTTVMVNNPQNPVAQALPGLSFSAAIPTGPPGTLDLHFNELFPRAFLKRIENTPGGPLTAIHQDVPGTAYCTQSGFTPEFSGLVAPAIGAADTGTRLLARFVKISPAVPFFVAPNEVTSSSGNLVAHLVTPPFAANFTGGTVLTSPGNTILPVSSTHTLDLLYEVTAAFPFLGINGCSALDDFKISVVTFHTIPPAKVSGHLAPLDPASQASATAPEPRFVP